MYCAFIQLFIQMLFAASADVLQLFSPLNANLTSISRSLCFFKSEPTSPPLDAEFLDKNALETRPRKRKVQLVALSDCDLVTSFKNRGLILPLFYLSLFQ